MNRSGRAALSCGGDGFDGLDAGVVRMG